MAEDKKYQDASLPLPPDVEESLCRCGGIAGLTGQLPGDDLLKRESALFRALADPLRLKILAMLAVQPLCVCVIKAVLGIADSKLSYHLSVLKKMGLIAGEAQGNWIIYRLTADGTAWTRQVIGDAGSRKNGCIPGPIPRDPLRRAGAGASPCQAPGGRRTPCADRAGRRRSPPVCGRAPRRRSRSPSPPGPG